jgi:hypothetical protein
VGTFTDWARFAQTPLGKDCLAPSFQPWQKHIVDPPLFAPRLVENVSLQLLATKLIENFSLLACQFVGFEALLAFHHEFLPFDLKCVSLLLYASFSFVGVLKVNRSDATGGFGSPQISDFRQPFLTLVELCIDLRNLLLGSSESLVFAVFQVLAVLQHRGERELEGHG